MTERTDRVSKTQTDVYHIRTKDDEHATICVREYTAQDLGGGRERHGGEILIYSSLGTYAHHWSHCGCRFKSFLLGTSRDYFMNKAYPGDDEEFDADRTIQAVREKVIEERKQGSLDKDVARALWDELDGVEVQTLEGFVNAMYAIDDLDFAGAKDLLSEPWDYARRRPVPETMHFWKDIWPLFTAELRKELA